MRQGFFFTLFFVLFFVSSLLRAQDISKIAGDWKGAIDVNGRELAINITFSYSDEMLDGTIDIPEQGAYTLPVEVLDFAGDTLVFQFQTGKGDAVFYGNRDTRDEQIEGRFGQAGQFFPFRLEKKTSANGLPETEIVIPTRAGQVGGSLILQENGSPLVILTSGSGSHDRDQTVAGFRTFRVLASQLYDAGYSTFRYDDRGIGQSEGDSDATLQELATDLVDIIEYIKSHYRSKVSGVILLGQSQGGLVASLAAHEVKVDGLILVATPFLRGDQIINDQIRKISEVQGISEQIVERNLKFQEKVYEAVRTGKGWETIEDELAERLEQQISKLPEKQRKALGDMSSFVDSQIERQLHTAKSRWFRSLINLEPTEVISSVEVPILAIFGEKDSQVLAKSNSKVAASLASSEGVSLQYTIIEDANHLFQTANTGMPSEYGMLKHEFAVGFMDSTIAFLDSIQFRAPD